MAARHGADELAVKEQQLEGWEEKLAQRAQALAESAKTLTQRRNAIAPLVQRLAEHGGNAPRELQELLVADPLIASPHVASAIHEADRTRASAVDARTRACQAWDEDLAKQTAALNAVVQSLLKVQKDLQLQLDQLAAKKRAEQANAEPVPLSNVKSRPSRATPAMPHAALGARPPSVSLPTGIDNRVHTRAKLKVQVDFESDHNFFTGFSSDISEGGLFVATVNIQPLGSPVEVAFALPTGEQVVARGRVRWIREADTATPGMGIQFENLSEDARDAVQQFISQRDPMFYTD